ncbi:hypothetical protein ACFFX0_09520 [Citricoccus parietis]|uniref:Uncharacterized protein n=1 Tax=Citricoccus parietis TaxID=592307 RepID=A0ABV5FXK8_9MICC
MAAFQGLAPPRHRPHRGRLGRPEVRLQPAGTGAPRGARPASGPAVAGGRPQGRAPLRAGHARMPEPHPRLAGPVRPC